MALALANKLARGQLLEFLLEDLFLGSDREKQNKAP